MKLKELQAGKEYAWVIGQRYKRATKIIITPEQLAQGVSPIPANRYDSTRGKIEVTAWERDFFTREYSWKSDYAPLGQIQSTWEEWEETEKVRQQEEEDRRKLFLEREFRQQEAHKELCNFIECNKEELEALFGKFLKPYSGTTLEVRFSISDLERILELTNREAVAA